MVVLLVEDDAGFAAALCRGLPRSGIAVDHAPDGAAALRMVSQQNYDVLLIDIGLPDVDGWALLRQLRQHTTSPAIALTAHAYPLHHAASRAAGFVEHVDKPVAFMKLVNAIWRVTPAAPPPPPPRETRLPPAFAGGRRAT
jgi:DNA-binding response OmpR family regulator